MTLCTLRSTLFPYTTLFRSVIVAGLDMDFQGKPFGPMPYLMATAEYVTKVHAVCTRTGNLAHYSYRKTDDENLVVLGEKSEYEPLSRAAYYKLKLAKEQKKKEPKDFIQKP